MRRFKDDHFMRYSSYYTAKTCGISVVCPKCTKEALIKYAADDDSVIKLQCLSCAYRNEKIIQIEKVSATAYCPSCLLTFRLDLEEKDANYKKLNIKCPHCGTYAAGEVKSVNSGYSHYDFIEKNGRDKYFEAELYYFADFKGKPLWAMSREHLAYLTKYVSSDLREGSCLKTADHALPAYIKSAKNRDVILKILEKLMEK